MGGGVSDLGTYTHEQVAELFGVNRQDVYAMPSVMACRIPGLGARRVRYSRTKIDALLAGQARVA